MADLHLQVNLNGTTEMKKTILWPNKKADQEAVVKFLFERNNWVVNKIKNINGSFWKIEVSNYEKIKKINLYISSIRDESRQDDEFKMQLGTYYPTNVEFGCSTIILGIYVIEPGQYILAGYDTRGYDLSTNPSLRGTRTSGLQKAFSLGLYKYDKCVMFKPDFIYYYINNYDNLFGKSFSDKIVDTQIRNTQVIYYGAPGTGKSHEIKRLTKEKSVIRTTFHPDSDYSTFVGSYKPVTEKIDVQVVPVVINNGISLDQNEGTYKEKRISYRFVIQAFLKAYLGAWKKYADKKGDEAAPQFLIIEEINRGNCAQIFGDLFQLLDRGGNGFSEYPIEADTDLKQEIEKAFTEDTDYQLENDIDVEGVIDDYTSNYNSTLSEDIQHGRVLLLPKNLYIWATMNTSDQSLFPIDSAFKRRWDWEYMPIGYKNTNWTIEIGTKKYNWVDFQKIINEKIYSVDNSEDKQLGDYFVNADRTDYKISADTLLNKILFYLWNDVCKDDPDQIFQWKDDKDNNKAKSIKFSDFFCDEKERKLQGFMAFLEVPAIGESDDSDNSENINSPEETSAESDNDINS